MAYKLGLKTDETLIRVEDAFKEIKNNYEIGWKSLENSDRKKILEIAKRLRNSDTYRIKNFELIELSGYIVTLIKEIQLYLKVYSDLINK